LKFAKKKTTKESERWKREKERHIERREREDKEERGAVLTFIFARALNAKSSGNYFYLAKNCQSFLNFTFQALNVLWPRSEALEACKKIPNGRELMGKGVAHMIRNALGGRGVIDLL
jgi:hypothetical protein